MKHRLSDEDLLGGAEEELLKDEVPKKKRKPATTAKKTKQEAPVKKSTIVENVSKKKKILQPGETKKPTLNNARIAILAFFSTRNNLWDTRGNVSTAVLGSKKAVEEDLKIFISGEITPMVRSGLLEFDKQTDTVRPNPEKYTIRSQSLLKFIKQVPQDPTKGISAGVLGGKVWGTKDEQWMNVRYGRAAGAILKKLASVGAVGFTQDNFKSPKLWYRLPVAHSAANP